MNRELATGPSNFDASNEGTERMEATLAMDGLSAELRAFVVSNVAPERMEALGCAVAFG